MKALLVVPHYWKPEETKPYGSTDPESRETRARAVRQLIQAWRGHLGITAIPNMNQAGFEAMSGAEHGLDILALVRGRDHLLDDEFCEKYKVKRAEVRVDDPRMLPFGSRALFYEFRYSYDMYIYSEDDLRPPDGFMLAKIAGFVELFGWRRVLLPNRYEWNVSGPALKTFIDPDINIGKMKKYVDVLPDEHFLRQRIPGREIVFRRAGNPHSGFFALTAEQLNHWVRQDHFLDQDCSFVGPLESAATLGLLKTFPIYKAFGRDAGWLEIQHLDPRYSFVERPPKPDHGAPP